MEKEKSLQDQLNRLTKGTRFATIQPEADTTEDPSEATKKVEVHIWRNHQIPTPKPNQKPDFQVWHKPAQ